MNTSREKIDTKPQGTGRLGLLIVGVGIVSAINLLATGALGFANLISGSSGNYVQLNNGQTVEVTKTSALVREDETIKAFVEEIYTAFFTSSGYLPIADLNKISKPTEDPGVEIDGTDGKLVATSTWESSFAFEPQLRKELLEEKAKVLPQSIFEQQKSIVFLPSYIGEPIPIADKPGHWTVNLVSTLIPLQDGKQLGEVIPNNKKIYLRAVTPPRYGEFSSETAEIIADTRRAGLEIYHQHELDVSELQREITQKI